MNQQNNLFKEYLALETHNNLLEFLERHDIEANEFDILIRLNSG